ncbi:MAG: CvpA family protein [Bacteroidota bacterium]
MKALDSILLTLLLWGAYKGFRRGFVVEVFSLASFGIAIVGSIALKNQLTDLYVRWYGSTGSIAHYAISTLLSIVIVIVVTLVGRFCSYLVNLALLGDLDKVLGILLGIFKWALFSSTFFWLASLLQLEIPDTYTADTVLFPLIKPLAPQLITWLASQLSAIQAWRDSTYVTDKD